MKKLALAGALLASGCAGVAHAQSALMVYGVLDTAIERLSASDGTHATLMQKTAHVPSTLGFAGNEELSADLQAGFVLEAALFLPTGASPPDGTLLGRQAYARIRSARYGEVRLGRQSSIMQSVLAAYDPDHFSTYSPALAMQLANLDQTSLDNMVSWVSPELAGWSMQLGATLAEQAAVYPNEASPQIAGAGSAKNGKAGIVQYRAGGFGVALAGQVGGQDLASGGSATQTMVAAGMNYRFGPYELGTVLWSHCNKLPNNTVPRVTALALGGAWRVWPSLRLNLEVGRARDNGLDYAGGAKARGVNDYLNIGADYDFSRRTTVYVRAGRITDEHGGFNGRQIAVSPAAREGVAVPVDGSARGMLFGLRHFF